MNKKTSLKFKQGPLDGPRGTICTDKVTIVMYPFSSLAWDGTFLGDVREIDVESVVVFNGYKICKFCFSEHYTLVHGAINMFPSIMDEMLPLFGLNKMGTHSIKFKSTLYILYRIEESDILLKDNNHLVSPTTLEEIRRIISLKRYLGLAAFDESKIMLRKDQYGIFHAIPFHENTISPVNKKIINEKTHAKWMGTEINERENFRKNLKINFYGNMTGELFKLVGKIENIINSIDNDLIYILSVLKCDIFNLE
jgi:hypothetical protein